MELTTFDDGVIWAVARIIEMYDEPTIAAAIAREAGLSYSTMRGLADDADIKYLEKLEDVEELNMILQKNKEDAR